MLGGALDFLGATYILAADLYHRLRLLLVRRHWHEGVICSISHGAQIASLGIRSRSGCRLC